VYGEIAVHHARLRVISHTKAAHRVIGVQEIGLCIAVDRAVPFKFIYPGVVKVVTHDTGVAHSGVPFEITYPPMHNSDGHAELIELSREQYAVLWIGCLFDIDVDAKIRAIANSATMMEARLEPEAKDVPAAAQQR
jgi:hypothetical protein